MYDLDDICKKYYNTVFKYLMSLTHNINLSEELTQETFCIAIKEINKFKNNCTISTWLCIIEVTRNVMYLRLIGFSFKEIANITGKNESWSKVVYHRGKKELEKLLKGGTADE